VVALEVDGRQALVFPLLNIEYDFRQFMEFASKVASALIRFLDEPRPEEPGVAGAAEGESAMPDPQ
jgi:hypothetical protein